ncbi:SDR family NAD(P)-dependent oxidoreductase [Marinospirillum perlucidum]|uniref:SDR family NAD(P)-dependent oxidoreductase n=1 Tax=Marinospirillum perlucidum TaxID=1982602 RepID=UPI000DF21F14|nr:SDR family NAD(P)-dependent oxidoreductase [Marinospirillum perlucidum]
MQQLIAGAGQGIGLELVRQSLVESHWKRIYALYRTSGEALQQLADEDSRLICLQVDQQKDEDLAKLPEQLDGKLQRVINTAGLLHSQALGIHPEKSLQQLSRQALQEVMSVNAINHLLLLQALQPRLARRGPLQLVSLSAKVGSIADNRLGGWYAYRASKAALNQLLKTLSIEMRRWNPESLVVALHPGTTATELSAPFQQRVPPEQLFSVERTARQLLEVMAGLDAEASGGFYSWDGSRLPW